MNQINKPYGYIYIIIDHLKNKVYVGKSKRINKINSYFGSGKIINNIRKKRLQTLEKKILGFCYSDEELKKSEEECIYFFRAYGADGIHYDDIYGYNLTPYSYGDGGDYTSNHPNKKEINKKKSISQKARWENPEERAKILDSRKNVWTDERKKERSKKYSGQGNPRYGCLVSKETRNKNSLSQQKHKKEKHVRWIDIDLNEMICLKNKGFSYKEIGEKLNVDKQVIYKRFRDLKNKNILFDDRSRSMSSAARRLDRRNKL